MHSIARACLVAILFALAPLAQADVWGYVDANGIAHFAAEKVDERYELFFRGGESFDTRTDLAQPARPAGAAGSLPSAPPRLLAFFEVSPAYRSVRHHLREAALTHRIDYELLQALIATESGFDPRAVSPKGAVGLMQVMPATAQRYGVSALPRQPVEQQLADPRTNIRAGSRYLRDLIARFPGRLELALAAYNAGEGAVQRAGNRIPNYPETRNYVQTVMQLYTVLKPPPAVLAARAGAPGRIRMELPGGPAAAVGGAARRGNLPPDIGAPAGATPTPALPLVP